MQSIDLGRSSGRAARLMGRALALAVLLAPAACAAPAAPTSPTAPAAPTLAPTAAPAATSAAPATAPTTPPTTAPAATAAQAASAGSPVAASSPVPAAKPAQVHLEVAYVATNTTHEPIHLAQALGYFAEQGLDVSLSNPSGAARMSGLISGQIQFTGISGSEIGSAYAAGVDNVVLASISETPLMSLYATKDVKSVQDLAGKSVGVGRVGAATDYAARLFLSHYGLANSVKIQAVGGSSPAVAAALLAGVVPAGVFAPPDTYEVASRGMTELVNGASLNIPWANAELLTTRAYLKEHPDIVKRFLTAYQKTWTFLGNPANKATVVADISKAEDLSNQYSAEASYQYVYPMWSAIKVPTNDPRALAASFDQAEEPKAKAARPEDLIDNTILKQVASELGVG